jgi:hypothetical protein
MALIIVCRKIQSFAKIQTETRQINILTLPGAASKPNYQPVAAKWLDKPKNK